MSNRITAALHGIKLRIGESIRNVGSALSRPTGDLANEVQTSVNRLTHGDQQSAVTIRTGAASTPGEQFIQETRFTSVEPIYGGGAPFRLTSSDGRGHYVYKPISMQKHGQREGIPSTPGALAQRETAAFRVDQLLGFGRVPPTAMIDGPYGPGSAQLWVYSRAVTARYRPSKPQSEEMAVLDYIIGSSDRHAGNYRIGRNEGIVAIDNELSFPERPDPWAGIRSEFVKSHQNVPLSEEVLRKVDAVDPNHLRMVLRDIGLSPQAVDGAHARLVEIQKRGMITGEAWAGRITTIPPLPD
ncbi:hypothetical protein IU474_31410 [Nocardia otitidiscaviarum]|uniref:hypothetical protein n=1 Tax=Nocardia otitidiscaviarum TaxID=1823 RepID=UPI001895FBAE|nr:hypothetical protein [Nocardia otitidiscaviarum]MBF6241553.1 hypothetical protein [Nocardia otitidiscaviarum]